MYGLKQALRTWYSKLDIYLLKCGFKRDVDDNNLYVKSNDGKLLVVIIYVDDIIFSSDLDHLNYHFEVDIKEKIEISMLDELSYFLRLKITHIDKRIFISPGNFLKC